MELGRDGGSDGSTRVERGVEVGRDGDREVWMDGGRERCSDVGTEVAGDRGREE